MSTSQREPPPKSAFMLLDWSMIRMTVGVTRAASTTTSAQTVGSESVLPSVPGIVRQRPSAVQYCPTGHRFSAPAEQSARHSPPGPQ